MEEESGVDESVVWTHADVSNNVVTLQELQKRRQALVNKRDRNLDQRRGGNPLVIQNPVEQILYTDTNIENSIAHCDTLNRVIESVPTSSDLSKVVTESLLDFSSDDSVVDPDYVPLSQITNVQPIESSHHIDWFPERDAKAEIGRESRSRKRKADRLSWKREHSKNNRMLGKEYLGHKKIDNKYRQTESKPKRTMGPLCNSQFCARSKVFFCAQLTEEMRISIFNEFWCMSWSQKKVFVSSMVDKTTTQRKTKGTDSRRSSSKAYYFKIEGKRERVCLKTFINTLGVKEWTIRYWLGDRNNKENQANVSIPSLINTESKRDSIKSYLSALPKLPSHYCRKSSTKQYLEPLIQSKTQLYNLYVEFASSSSKPIASRKLFCDVLAEENIGLFQPKKDACDICCAYKVGNVLEEDYLRHIELKNMAREEKSKDKQAAKNGIIHTVTADLQAVKLCPFLTASALYFKTKLAVHNFTIYNLGTDDVTCYWFDETTCDLKATTYASFFVDYVTKVLDEDAKDIVIWTDGCTSQNRNNIVSNVLLRLAINKNITITQKYLEKGHTQMEVDSVHSVIERKLKNCEIFLPSQYATLTKQARKKPSPYRVIQPAHTFFKDYGIKEYQIYDSIRPGRTTGDDCVVDLRVLQYSPDGTIQYKNHFKDDLSPLPRRPRNILTLLDSVPLLFPSRVPIQESKYQHLQQLKDVIPGDCHQFYDNLPYKKNK